MLSQPARRFMPAVVFFQSARAPLSRRTFTSTQAIFNSTQKPSAYKEGMNQYRTFTGPFAKVFLGGRVRLSSPLLDLVEIGDG
ncbi:hypothetical protein N7489_001334 [Penicillium chrysogenum]|uniref:uncharacterized protein n=1 Tax=Penicillium chrysogenum TaxID=5076 RepID=UPI0024DF1F3A|nr:uncharacterized protein N7489_001334 [Penicillium chrysogenum]KAJ5250924.1 hypothetical protein N7489_001334 [Penicillium chrysogenum]